MILGKIFGKITTSNFRFLVEKETKKFEFVQVLHKVYEYVLCQVVEIERTDKDIANCIVIGYKDDKGRIKPIRIPFDQGAEVLKAEDEFIKSIIKLEDSEKGAFIGKLEGKNIDVQLDLKKLLTKHVAILAKSGAGKSYTVGVLVEEIIEKNVPILIIDPHGEFSSLKYANEEEQENLARFNLKPKSFKGINMYGDPKLDPEVRPLMLNNNLTPQEIVHLIPGKLSNTQLGLLYSALKHIEKVDFTNVLLSLDAEENNSKWTIINNLEYLNNLGIFTDSYVSYNEFIQPGKCSVINLKGISPDVQEIIVYKLMKDLFELRKKEKIPPFFTIIEEAHNYCPERSFGETRCSKILRTVASEGRKFGLGLCVISQRPARVDKSVLSQCTTQIIMKVTNPNDLKAISNSVEGITAESQDEVKNLPVGSAMITGIVDMPLFVNIRPRMTKHGGQAAEILETVKEEQFFEKLEEFNEEELLPIIRPKITAKELKLMSDKEIQSINNVLIPGFLFVCQGKNQEYNILIDMVNGEVVTDIDSFETKKLPELDKLSQDEIRLLHAAFQMKSFKETDLTKKGLPLDMKQELINLKRKGFIQESGSNFNVSEKFILSQLSNHACYNKIEFLKMAYNHKESPRKSIDEIKEKLSKFTSIKDQRECHILKYDIIYK
ncbi:ATP-binding protein [Candidatus Woesearchaeota archaeon]|nr:ATP-binding protein [Candidatus Woesearchaeota archaeon]